MNKISVLLISITLCLLNLEASSQDLKIEELDGHFYIGPSIQNLVLLQNMNMETFKKVMDSNDFDIFSNNSGPITFIAGEFPTRFQTVTKDNFYNVTSTTWMNEKSLDMLKAKLELDLATSLVDSGEQYDIYIMVIDGIRYKILISNGGGNLVELMIGHSK